MMQANHGVDPLLPATPVDYSGPAAGQALPVDYLLRCESWRESYRRVHVVERMHNLGDVFSNVAQTPLGQCFSGRAAIRQWGFA